MGGLPSRENTVCTFALTCHWALILFIPCLFLVSNNQRAKTEKCCVRVIFPDAVRARLQSRNASHVSDWPKSNLQWWVASRVSYRTASGRQKEQTERHVALTHAERALLNYIILCVFSLWLKCAVGRARNFHWEKPTRVSSFFISGVVSAAAWLQQLVRATPWFYFLKNSVTLTWVLLLARNLLLIPKL